MSSTADSYREGARDALKALLTSGRVSVGARAICEHRGWDWHDAGEAERASCREEIREALAVMIEDLLTTEPLSSQ